MVNNKHGYSMCTKTVTFYACSSISFVFVSNETFHSVIVIKYHFAQIRDKFVINYRT